MLDPSSSVGGVLAHANALSTNQACSIDLGFALMQVPTPTEPIGLGFLETKTSLTVPPTSAAWAAGARICWGRHDLPGAAVSFC